MNNYQIEALLIDLLRSGGNLIINKHLIKKVGLIPAILLSNYLEKHLYFKKKHPENDGWFFLVHKKITEELKIKDYSITQAKKELINSGVVQFKRQGIPAKEWIKIDFNSFANLLIDENCKSQVPPKTASLEGVFSLAHNKTISNKTKEEELNYIVAENSATVNSKNEKYLPIAYKLGEIITSKKKIKINQSKLKSWAVSIRQLIERDGVQIERVNTALDWYSDNIGGDYVPVIESGKSLREKFIKLENAIERDKKPIAGKTRTGFKRGKLKYKRPEKL